MFACNKKQERVAVTTKADSLGFAASGGVRADSGAVPMRVSDYRLTRPGVNSWRGAQRSLAAMQDDTTFVPVRTDGEISDAEVDRLVRDLEDRPESRRAIEQSGLSVRDYVLTTLALERAERARASSEAVARRSLPIGNLDLASEYAGDLRNTRGTPGFHIVDYGDDDEDGGGGKHRGHGHHHGKHKGWGKH